MAVPADHDVDARHLRRDLQIAVQANMGQRDDLVGALAFDLRHDGVEVADLIRERDVRTGRGRLVGVRRQHGDDADFLTADLKDHIAVQLRFERRLIINRGVAGDHRKGRLVHEARQNFRPVVEFMVADRHRVETHLVHELDRRVALVGRIEKRALELVARIQRDDILPGQRGAALVQVSLHAGDAAKALAFGVVLRRAGAVIFRDRLNSAVQIVDVQDGQPVVGLRRAGGGDDRGGCKRGERAGWHGGPPCVCDGGERYPPQM